MFQNLEISQKLYSLKSLITDNDDLLLINKIIDKYKTEIKIDFEYTDREMYGSAYVFNNILKGIYTEPNFWSMPNVEDSSTWILNEDLFDRVELFDIECNKLINKFSLLRIKNNKNKNELTRQNSILIQNIFIEEINQLIKNFKL